MQQIADNNYYFKIMKVEGRIDEYKSITAEACLHIVV